MCLAIYKPADKKITREHLENGFQKNTDGCGIAFSENGKLTIIKGLFTFDKFYEEYTAREHLPMLIHFRWATHGGTNQLNCHPFDMCDGKYAVIHNGVISIKTTIAELSDTGNFVRLVLEPMFENGIEPFQATPENKYAPYGALKFLIEQTIGKNNKIVVMDGDGRVSFFNEDGGAWDGGVWFSNTGYKYGSIVRYTGHDYTEYDNWSKKNESVGCGSTGNCYPSTNHTGNKIGFTGSSGTYSVEIESELTYLIGNMQCSRQEAIDYLIHEGVIEPEEEEIIETGMAS